MKMETHIDCVLLSDKLEKMVIERFLIKKLKPGDKIHFKQLEQAGALQIKKYIRYLPEFSSDICSFSDYFYVTSDENLLQDKKNRYTRSLIHKLLVPLSYNDNDAQSFLDRFVNENGYNENEKQFIDETQRIFLNICDIDEDNFLTSFCEVNSAALIEKMKSNGLMNFSDLRYCIRNILNKIAHAELRCGDEITDLLSSVISTDFFQKVNSDTTLFFECRDNGYFLTCDLETNRNIFLFYLFNYLAWDFEDLSVRTMFLIKLHILINIKGL